MVGGSPHDARNFLMGTFLAEAACFQAKNLDYVMAFSLLFLTRLQSALFVSLNTGICGRKK